MKAIPIKTERDVERRLEVKKERKSTGQCEIKSTPVNWEEEKQTLVQKIVALKNENDQNLLMQKKLHAQYDTILLSKQKLEQTILAKEEAFAMEMEKLKLELSKAKKELTDMKLNDEKTIADLKRENQLLVARTKQFQTGMQQKLAFENQMKLSDMQNTNTEIEVGAILNH